MIDNDKLIIFACQVLEYQPEPSNQWTTVGHLEKKRACHAVLSIGCEELLPSLQGCLEQDDLFVVRSCYHQDYHDQQHFHHHPPACQIVIYMPLL